MRTERWAFCESELANPAKCKSHDELLASVTTGPDSSEGIIVYRNGKASNRFADGTAGVPADLADEAEADEELYHPDLDETTNVWADVFVDHDGAWLGWAGPVPVAR
jgi:hypothetical protein